jgi:ribosomal protein S27AE
MGLSSRKCPKCGGILMMGSYLGEWYENCVQCGNLMYLDHHNPQQVGRTPPSEGKWEAMLAEAKSGSVRRSGSSVRSRRK